MITYSDNSILTSIILSVSDVGSSLIDGGLIMNQRRALAWFSY